MLLAFGVILLAVCFGIIISIYSMFFPFFENLKNIAQYNSAYYAAIASVERGELVLRYRGPGFQGTGGFINTGDVLVSKGGPNSDVNSDFGIVNNDGNGMWWIINSRTTSVPNVGGGNVEVMLAGSDSLDYNMLDYSHTEIVNLDVDNTTNKNEFYRTGSNIKIFSGDYISGVFRLPPKIFSGFDDGFDNALLCDNDFYNICDPNGDGLYNDAIVNRTLKGDYSGETFSITPTFSVDYNVNPATVLSFDTFIRESLFNIDPMVAFSTSFSNFSPIESISGYPQVKHNVMGQYAGEVQGKPFNEILGGLTGLSLKFSLMDLLRTKKNNVYPFLEYKLEFSDEISDRFYNIQGVGQVGDYDVHINISKPTSNESTAGQFTIIF